MKADSKAGLGDFRAKRSETTSRRTVSRSSGKPKQLCDGSLLRSAFGPLVWDKVCGGSGATLSTPWPFAKTSANPRRSGAHGAVSACGAMSAQDVRSCSVESSGRSRNEMLVAFTGWDSLAAPLSNAHTRIGNTEESTTWRHLAREL